MCTILHMLHTILGLILDTPLDGVNYKPNMARMHADVVLRLISSGIGATAGPSRRLPGFGRGFKMS